MKSFRSSDLIGFCLSEKFRSERRSYTHISLVAGVFAIGFLSKKSTFAFTPGEYQMPVGRRNSVWTLHCWSKARRIFSPAPPSNNTLSGTTTAARHGLVGARALQVLAVSINEQWSVSERGAANSRRAAQGGASR